MSDLWILDHVDTGGGTRPPNWKYRKASRPDVLEWLGWEECGDCSGSNCKWDGDHGTRDCEPCDYCLGGLVPPASQVEAARQGWFAAEGHFPDVLMRAALIAAMEAVSDD